MYYICCNIAPHKLPSINLGLELTNWLNVIQVTFSTLSSFCAKKINQVSVSKNPDLSNAYTQQ